jgi:hypothetical protein
MGVVLAIYFLTVRRSRSIAKAFVLIAVSVLAFYAAAIMYSGDDTNLWIAIPACAIAGGLLRSVSYALSERPRLQVVR